VRSRLAALPLRVRIGLLAVGLLAFALIVAGLATRYELQRFLVQRLDQQIAQAESPPLMNSLMSDEERSGPPPGILPSGAYVTLLPKCEGCASFYNDSTVPPRAVIYAVSHAPLGRSSAGGYRIDVGLVHDIDHDNPSPIGERYAIAVPLADVNSTLERLAVLELVVGLAVLAAGGTLAYVLVRRELQPLQRIEDTAAAIAAGDLSQRVEEADPATEIGSLGRSLNEMLAQIEEAFDQRSRSERRLRRFVADASHELRTPLTSVRGFAELFRRGAAERPDDLALAMSRIEQEAARMSLLVDDLLLLAQLDQGRPLEHEPVDIVALVTELVDDHRLLHPEWPIELTTTAADPIEGDEQRLRQALGNLLANVRAHTPEGTGVHVDVTPVADGVQVEVADDGPGLPPDLVDQVFERFVRADPSRTRASGGTGLGLSIVASIVAAHGGHVSAANGDGGGARFTVVLPERMPSEEATGLPAPAAAEAAGPDARPPGITG
jgi:two-component system OmpR family sensor kinase